MKKFIEKYYSYFLSIGLALEILILLLSLIESGSDWHMYFRVAARLSGRISLLYFALFFIYATLNQSIEKENASLKIKFVLTKNFTILHVIHWFLLVTAKLINGFPMNIFRLFVILGIVAYLIIVLMPFVLNGSILKSLKLKIVQNVYVYYVWFIFFTTYLARLSGDSPRVTGSMYAYIVLMAVTLGLLIWRIGFLLSERKHNSRPR